MQIEAIEPVSSCSSRGKWGKISFAPVDSKFPEYPQETIRLSPMALRNRMELAKQYIELNEVEAVLAGKSEPEMVSRVFNCFYDKIAVYIKGAQGTQPPELVGLYKIFRQMMVNTESPREKEILLKDMFKIMKKSLPGDFASFILFRNLEEVASFFNSPISEEPFTPKQALFIGGMHGTERSGIENAKKLDKEYSGNSRIRVISEANPEACRLGKRRLADGDLNRMFPGDAVGKPLEKRAAEIYREARKADLIIDFHESKAHFNEGGLGKTCIFYPGTKTLQALKSMEKVLLEEGFRFGANPFRGELVREISERENKAAFLLEIPRTMSMEERVKLAEKLSTTAIATFKLNEKPRS